jgi:hypothetical protein
MRKSTREKLQLLKQEEAAQIKLEAADSALRQFIAFSSKWIEWALSITEVNVRSK